MGGIAAAEDGCAGFGGAKGSKNLVLQDCELLIGLGLGSVIAGDGDIYYRTGDDVGREEDRREFDLEVPTSASRVYITKPAVRAMDNGSSLLWRGASAGHV